MTYAFYSSISQFQYGSVYCRLRLVDVKNALIPEFRGFYLIRSRLRGSESINAVVVLPPPPYPFTLLTPLLAGLLLLANCMLSQAYSMVWAAKLMHRNLLQGVLRAPQAFFESNPIGRLINRFSKDMDAIDSQLPHQIDIWMRTFWYTLNVLLICSALTPMFLIVVAPLMVFYWWVQVNSQQVCFVHVCPCCG